MLIMPSVLLQPSKFDPIIDFGLQPVSNRFLPVQSTQSVPHYDLALEVHRDSGLIRLSKPFPVHQIRPIYDWLTVFEPENHLDDLVDMVIALPGITRDSTFGGYSFKDDSTLERLANRGYKNYWRIDPIMDLGVVDKCASVETYQAIFNRTVADQTKQRLGAADVLFVRHVVEHAYDLPNFVSSLKLLTKPSGYIVWELPDCERALTAGDITMVWEEHRYYFTRETFKTFILSQGLQILHVSSIPYALENCVIAITSVAGTNTLTPEPLLANCTRELERAQAFRAVVNTRAARIRSHLNKMHEMQGHLCMFGAGHLAVAFLSILELAHLIAFVVDDNPNKNGMRMPVGGLEVLNSDALYRLDSKTCLLSLNPYNQPEVIAKHQRFIENGGGFMSIFPHSQNDIGVSNE